MLQEKGFFFVASCTNASSCQEWKQQVELAFESLKCPINDWWDEYINYIQNVQLRTMQTMTVANKPKFLEAWQ